MADYSPFSIQKQAHVAPVAAASDFTSTVCEAPFDGKISSASYTPDAGVTGANTETRTIQIINKGQAGSGTTAVATLALTSGVNMTADDEKALTLSSTAADLVVAQGDIIAFKSTHSGSTGLADPGGLVQVEFQQAQA